MKGKASSGGSSGVQLLSPTIQRDLRVTTIMTSGLMAANNQSDAFNPRATAFDFDGFTIEAVRRRHDEEQQQQQHTRHCGAGSYTTVGTATTASTSSDGSPNSPSMLRASSRYQKLSGYERMTSIDGCETSSVRSMEDYEWGQSTRAGPARHQSLSSASSNHNTQYFGSQSFAAPLVGSTIANKRMSVTSSTASSAVHATTVQRPRPKAEVVMSGWLQRRRGRVLKRWKSQFCLLKSDHKLCVYANEDIVNGKLEARFQVLRVALHEKTGTFQVIGLGVDDTPCKEEFRTPHDQSWRGWFHVFRSFFDEASLHDVLDRMPELSVGTGTESALFDEDHDFAQEVEEMIMRPYAFGNQQEEERLSLSSNGTNNTIHSASDHSTKRKTSTASSVRVSIDRPQSFLQPSSNNAQLHPPTTQNKHLLNVDGLPDDLPEYLSAARASQRTFSHAQSHPHFSSALAAASHLHQHDLHGARHRPPPRGSQSQSQDSDDTTDGTASDVPMIERDSQTPMPILERRGSESVASNVTRDSASDFGFSWNRP
ncbi:hypothetical protein ATCC90586_007839 [Pythium insidiosum]|nr:hypothetical protein ATCC90586_007839 [Pythium insidiosum]